MAYKFQLGAFVASGSIKAEEGVNANSAGLGAAGAIAGATTIAASGLASVGSVVICIGIGIGTGLFPPPPPPDGAGGGGGIGEGRGSLPRAGGRRR